MKRTRWLILIGLLALVVSLVAACGDDETPTPTTAEAPPTPAGPKTANVLGVWGGDELTNFQASVAPWEERTGLAMGFSGTRDLSAILTTRIEADNPPDIAVLPNPGLMQELARDGKLIALDDVLDMDKIRNEYSQAWIDLGTVDGKFYAIYYKAANKGTIWYSPKTFAANGWEVPGTWDELVALSDEIKASGLAPWSVAVESGGASGWPGTDWIGEILLHESGPEVYDNWVSHDIPWTDAGIKSAFEKFGWVTLTEGNVPGGAQAALATFFIDGSYLPFEDPPQAAMYYLGSFTQGFISDQFPDLTAGEDYSFFSFPTINDAYAGAVTGGADVVVMLNDNATSRSLMNYLASAEPQNIWAGLGGFTAVNNQVSASTYPDELAGKTAEQLSGASIYRFDADDSMPSAVQSAFWTGILNYLGDPSSLDAVLAEIESVAVDSY